MRFRTSILAAAAAVLVASCATLGLATPKGFDQQLAEAYGVHTAVVNATATALTAGAITSADAGQVQVLAVQSRLLLDSAKALEGTDPSTAAGKLALATSVLTQIQTYLNSRGSH